MNSEILYWINKDTNIALGFITTQEKVKQMRLSLAIDLILERTGFSIYSIRQYQRFLRFLSYEIQIQNAKLALEYDSIT